MTPIEIIDSLPRGIVAGGAARYYILKDENDTVNDIDVFIRNNSDIKVLDKHLLSIGYKKYKETKYSISYFYKQKFNFIDLAAPPVQIINFKKFKTPKAVTDSFDFHVCAFAVDPVSKETFVSYTGVNDFKSKTLTPLNIIPSPIFFYHLEKYLNRGYKVTNGFFKHLVEKMKPTVYYTELDDY